MILPLLILIEINGFIIIQLFIYGLVVNASVIKSPIFFKDFIDLMKE